MYFGRTEVVKALIAAGAMFTQWI
ncbi:MAG: hypothetical protein ACR5KV_01870 [Wolbachia sp.]